MKKKPKRPRMSFKSSSTKNTHKKICKISQTCPWATLVRSWKWGLGSTTTNRFRTKTKLRRRKMTMKSWPCYKTNSGERKFPRFHRLTKHRIFSKPLAIISASTIWKVTCIQTCKHLNCRSKKDPTIIRTSFSRWRRDKSGWNHWRKTRNGKKQSLRCCQKWKRFCTILTLSFPNKMTIPKSFDFVFPFHQNLSADKIDFFN